MEMNIGLIKTEELKRKLIAARTIKRNLYIAFIILTIVTIVYHNNISSWLSILTLISANGYASTEYILGNRIERRLLQ